jgi:hypothetical protein
MPVLPTDQTGIGSALPICPGMDMAEHCITCFCAGVTTSCSGIATGTPAIPFLVRVLAVCLLLR